MRVEPSPRGLEHRIQLEEATSKLPCKIPGSVNMDGSGSGLFFVWATGARAAGTVNPALTRPQEVMTVGGCLAAENLCGSLPAGVSWR